MDAVRKRLFAAGRLLLRSPSTVAAAVTLLGVGGILWAAWTNSPGYDETAHLASGIYHWQTGRFGAYHVNPPLPRLCQTAIVQGVPLQLPLGGPNLAQGGRFEWPLAEALANQQGPDVFKLLALARLANLVPYVGLVVLAGYWASKLTPKSPIACGVAAAVLVASDPTSLAAAAIVTPDIWASFSGLVATVAVWQYVRSPSMAAAWQAGMAMGFAVACKFTWIPVLGLWGAYCLAGGLLRRDRPEPQSEQSPSTPTMLRRATATSGDVVLAVAAGWLLVLLTYGFEDIGRPFGSFNFTSRALRADWVDRAQDGPAGTIPIPLSSWMVKGLDIQKSDFDSDRFPSYFAGEHSPLGDRRFYLTVLLHKWPLPWLFLLVVGLAGSLIQPLIQPLRGGKWSDTLVWSVPLAVFVLVSSFTGFSHHFRYAGPATPFLCLIVARLAATERTSLRVGFWLLVSIGLISVAAQAPHFLKYENGLARLSGGTGVLFGRSMYDSTVDWGQDYRRLRSFLDDHPEVSLSGMQHNSMPSVLKALDLPISGVPPIEEAIRRRNGRPSDEPLWYVLNDKWLYSDDDRYAGYRTIEPWATIGGTMHIYRIPPVRAQVKTRPTQQP